jgi:hypothetical protein
MRAQAHTPGALRDGSGPASGVSNLRWRQQRALRRAHRPAAGSQHAPGMRPLEWKEDSVGGQRLAAPQGPQQQARASPPSWSAPARQPQKHQAGASPPSWPAPARPPQQQQPAQQPARRPGALPLRRGLRPDDFRHPLDRQNTALLRALPGIEVVAKAIMGPVAEEVLVIENLGSSIKTGPAQLPSIHALLIDAVRRWGGGAVGRRDGAPLRAAPAFRFRGRAGGAGWGLAFAACRAARPLPPAATLQAPLGRTPSSSAAVRPPQTPVTARNRQATTLQMETVPDLYVRQSPHPNAVRRLAAAPALPNRPRTARALRQRGCPPPFPPH